MEDPQDAAADPAPAPPGWNWLTSAEAGYVRPRFSAKGGQPGADLPWAVTPTITLGYQLATTAKGALVLDLSYRNLTAREASAARSGAAQDGLDSHLIDLDLLISRDPAPNWGWQCKCGFRLARIFTNSRIDSGASWTADSNEFVGGGPHLEAAAFRRIGETPSSLYFGGEWAGLLGNNDVRTGGVAGPAARNQHGRLMDQLRLWAGLHWDWVAAHWMLRLTAGYQLEVWSHHEQISYQQAVQDNRYTVGNAPAASRSLTDLQFHGPFLRAEIRY
jgi:hypothetical protein